MATSRTVVGFWLVHAVRRPEGLGPAMEELLSLVRAGRLQARRRRHLPAGGGPPGARGAAHPRHGGQARPAGRRSGLIGGARRARAGAVGRPRLCGAPALPAAYGRRVGRDEAERSEVYRITSATGGRSADMQQRVGRYLFSMAVRTVCVVLCIVVPGPLRWVFAVGAIALPYIAVVAANTVGERRAATPAAAAARPPGSHRPRGPGPGAPPGGPAGRGGPRPGTLDVPGAAPRVLRVTRTSCRARP